MAVTPTSVPARLGGHPAVGDERGVRVVDAQAVVDTNGQVKLMGNQIVYNSTGGLVKLSQTNTYIESLNNNYIASNGWVQGSPPDEVPAISPTR